MRLRVGLKTMMLASAMFAAPAFAQDVSETEIDALIGQSETPDTALALARKQSGDGDLLGAAATLERALLNDPRAQQVRLYYVALLCRLGDAQTARSELAKTDGRAIDDSAWAEITTACGDVSRPVSARGGGITGSVSLGVTYDSDLANSLLVQLDIPTALPADDGFSFVGAARLGGRVPAGGAFFYGSAGVTTRNGFSSTASDYQTGDITLGLGARTGSVGEFAIGGIVRHLRIDGDPFVTDLGGELSYSLLMGDGRLTLRGEVVQQDYNGSTALFSRNGMHYDVGLGYQHGGLNGFWLGAAYEGKDADTARTGYSGVRAYAGVRAQLSESGVYTALNGSVRYVEYKDEIGYVPVHETRYFLRGAVGVPIGAIDLEAAGSYSRRDYNAASTFKDYDNVGAELRLVWNFGN